LNYLLNNVLISVQKILNLSKELSLSKSFTPIINMSVNKFTTYLAVVFVAVPLCLSANENQNSDNSSNQTYPISEVSSSTSQKDSPKTDESLYVLDDFVVSAENDVGYYSANSISATRTNELVKNTPITLTVVNEQMMEDLNILNDQDLDQVTASVTREPDGFSENQLRIRGFRSLTQRYDLFWRELERDGYNIQRATSSRVRTV